MDTDKLLVLVEGIILILCIAWYFFGKKETASVVTDFVDITVKGGYNPSLILIPKGKTIQLNFIRTDENSCLEDVVIPALSIKKHLPMNEKVSVSVHFQKEGSFEITCGMNMFHGKIIVI